MNDLVKIVKRDVFTDTMVIAEGTGIAHRKIKESIKKYHEPIERFGLLASYQAESTGGRPEEYYRLNEKQASFLLTLLKNTEIVVEFKARLVEQFYAMRQQLIEKQSSHWQQTRLESKTSRKMETDAVKVFVAYAKSQGSQNADRYYCNFSRLANETVGIISGGRDGADASHLNNMILAENIISQTIQNGIKSDIYYKDIYKICRDRITQFAQLAYLGTATYMPGKILDAVKA